LVLTRLSRTQGASIVLRVADKPLPSELVSQIVDKTDGVPLFLEELTKAVLESTMLADLGDRYDYSGKVDRLAIPDNLRDSLMARLDRLIPVKEIAQIGACLGRTFSYELVRAVAPMAEAELGRALDKLSASELVFQRGTPPDAVYTFKHALVQDAAYDSLLKTKRQALHAQIAEALKNHFPAKTEVEPELLAHHYTEAGLIDTAIPYWQKAGEVAQNRVALQEAMSYYERGLDLTAHLPASKVRDTHELRLRALLGITWVTMHGYSHPQVAANLKAALALDRSLEHGDYTLRILWGLWVYTLCAGRIRESLQWADKLIARSEQTRDHRLGLAGHWAACDSHYFLGNFAQSIQHAEAVLGLYDAERDRSMADLITHDPKTIALAYRATAQWRLGYPDRAAASAEAAISHSRERKHVFDLCWVHTFLAHTLFIDSGSAEAMASALDLSERVAGDQRIPFFTEVYCPLSRAFWHVRSGRPQDAVARFEEVAPRWRAAGLEIYLPTNQTLHAESLLRCGRIDAAMQLLDEALERIARPGWEERGCLSEVLRVKAWALQETGDAQQAEALFTQALDVARAQNARSWELRAAISYARLLKAQNRVEDALTAVRSVYEWFTEGHGSGDLHEAATLLAELEAQRRSCSPE
jgi:predicted ATPase